MTVLFIFGELFSHSTLLTGVCRHHGGRDRRHACVLRYGAYWHIRFIHCSALLQPTSSSPSAFMFPHFWVTETGTQFLDFFTCKRTECRRIHAKQAGPVSLLNVFHERAYIIKLNFLVWGWSKINNSCVPKINSLCTSIYY
jgi:hypothetical protein